MKITLKKKIEQKRLVREGEDEPDGEAEQQTVIEFTQKSNGTR